MLLVQRKKYWVLYDENGKIIVITYDKRIAEGFARVRRETNDRIR